MTLTNQNIFILGLTQYGDGIESTNFTLARHLAAENNVFYIENPYTWKDIAGPKRRQWKTRNKTAYNGIIATDLPRLRIVTTPVLPSINWLPEGRLYRAALGYNEWRIFRAVQKIIWRFDMEDYIFINSFNFYYPGVGRLLAPELSVYHCVDPLVFPIVRKHGERSERQLVQESDVVVCTSRRLYEEKVTQNKNSFFIPNAADITHSAAALDPAVPVHESLQHISKPVAGYFGNIERRLDYELLDEVTNANPGISFVFAGPVSREFIPQWFFERPNVHLTGPMPYSQMPQVLKGFDAAMIPFKKDEFSATIFPLKLFEYLGAGKSVVATDFNPDLQEFTGDVVTFCPDAGAYSSALQHALANDTGEQLQARLEIARQNTWERRAGDLSGLIYKYLQQKRSELKGLPGMSLSQPMDYAKA